MNKELEELKLQINTLQTSIIEKQRLDYKTQLIELILTVLPVSALFTIAPFFIFNYILINQLPYSLLFISFPTLFLILFCIGAVLSFWQEEFAIVKLSISLGKLYNLSEINSLKHRLAHCLDSGIVDESQFIERIIVMADNYYLFNKPLPKLQQYELQFLKDYNLISQNNDGKYIFSAPSKNELLKSIKLALS